MNQKLLNFIVQEFQGDAFRFLDYFPGEMEELVETGSVEIDYKETKLLLVLEVK